ncbi:MAG: helix-turn-helix domain-containing protein [Clostridia bacterium]|nr:helix-turn-helix domain-containing protein [Clostridia bacterium]
MKEFIKLPREFFENEEICKSPEHLYLYVHILSSVAFEDGTFSVVNGKRVELERGQMVTSIRKLAEKTGIPKSSVSRMLAHFKKWDVIWTDGGTSQTIIAVTSLCPLGTRDGTEESQNMGQSWDEEAERKGEKRKEAKEKSSKERFSKSIKNSKKKNVYGTFENVKLTDEEYESFKSKFPVNYERYIDDLSHYIASRGDKYKSHYATLLTWNRDKSDEMSSFDTDEFFEAAVKRSAERIRQRASEGTEEKPDTFPDLGW